MSEIVKDLNKIWDRLFDQKGFLSGEVAFNLKEFEEKRGDTDVDNLFNTIENITDIRETKISYLKELVNEKIIDANHQISTSLELCGKFEELERKYSETEQVEDLQTRRKVIWNKFMDDITSEYSTLNSEFESKEADIKGLYEDLKKKLK